MDASKTSTSRYWLYFLISLAICVTFLFFIPGWFWVPLPFICTFLVKALDMM